MTYHTNLQEIVKDLENQIARATPADRKTLLPRLHGLIETVTPAVIRHQCRRADADDDLLFDNVPF